MINIDNKGKKSKEGEVMLAQNEAIRQQHAKLVESYRIWFDRYVSANGTPDKTIVIKDYDRNEVIHIHEATKSLYLQGKSYAFNDIIDCSVTDNPTTIKGQIIATTKTKTGSIVKRMIIGGMIAGDAGAVIGGVTGKKSTKIRQENDTIIHNYTILINVNSITTPIISINTGTNIDLTNEIVGLMNVIITRSHPTPQ